MKCLVEGTIFPVWLSSYISLLFFTSIFFLMHNKQHTLWIDEDLSWPVVTWKGSWRGRHMDSCFLSLGIQAGIRIHNESQVFLVGFLCAASCDFTSTLVLHSGVLQALQRTLPPTPWLGFKAMVCSESQFPHTVFSAHLETHRLNYGNQKNCSVFFLSFLSM